MANQNDNSGGTGRKPTTPPPAPTVPAWMKNSNTTKMLGRPYTPPADVEKEAALADKAKAIQAAKDTASWIQKAYQTYWSTISKAAQGVNEKASQAIYRNMTVPVQKATGMVPTSPPNGAFVPAQGSFTGKYMNLNPGFVTGEDLGPASINRWNMAPAYGPPAPNWLQQIATRFATPTGQQQRLSLADSQRAQSQAMARGAQQAGINNAEQARWARINALAADAMKWSPNDQFRNPELRYYYNNMIDQANRAGVPAGTGTERVGYGGYGGYGRGGYGGGGGGGYNPYDYQQAKDFYNQLANWRVLEIKGG